MPKILPETAHSRREEIISACEKLYQSMSFKDITLIEIGKITSFTRTAIYNYFNTKEEIFLALLQREYELWIEELEKILSANESLTREQFGELLARSLENRRQLLKLMSMNHFDMEMNSRQENLTEFKRAYGKSLQTVKKCLDKFFPAKSELEKQNFIYSFFPFVYGIYPYAVVTEKQRQAMETADTDFIYYTIYELAYNCIVKLLS